MTVYLNTSALYSIVVEQSNEYFNVATMSFTINNVLATTKLQLRIRESNGGQATKQSLKASARLV